MKPPRWGCKNRDREKGPNKKYVMIAKVVAVLVFLGVIALALWGVVLLSDYNNLIGILSISIAALVSLAQIVTGIVLFKKHH